jgi:hypothetical protein
MLKRQRNNAIFRHRISSFSFEIFIRACQAEALAKAGVSRLESGCNGGELGKSVAKKFKIILTHACGFS